MPKKCIVCWERKPEVPDRNQMGRPIKRVCFECHKQRLMEDVKKVVGQKMASIQERAGGECSLEHEGVGD